MYNILLVIVDCLRYDMSQEMPFLSGLWNSRNHWATSHCTDPCVTHILTGKHPDELRLYSMMFGDRDYTIPETRTIFHEANDAGYDTGFITNLQRWYNRGVGHFVNSRHMHPDLPWECARQFVGSAEEPWLLVLHTDDMHTNYYGGSYQAAAEYTDKQLCGLFGWADLSRTVFIVTADHGEGLGQAGPDGHVIEQHGYGLWEFLTHIPLAIHYPPGEELPWVQKPEWLTDHGVTCGLILEIVHGFPVQMIGNLPYVYQAGATPRFFHRGVVDRTQRQFVRCLTKGKTEPDFYWIGDFSGPEDRAHMELLLKEHCTSHGIKYGALSDEAAVLERLERLGYWSQE